MATKHGQGSLHQCSLCSYTNADRTRLKLHVMAKHEGVKFTCDQCDFKSSYEQSLRIHIMMKHTVTE